MRDSIKFNPGRWLLLVAMAVILSASSSLIEPDRVQVDMPLASANESLLDQIFEEEKSDRLCKFIKNKESKVWFFLNQYFSLFLKTKKARCLAAGFCFLEIYPWSTLLRSRRCLHAQP